jgi:hypothetical protein
MRDLTTKDRIFEFIRMFSRPIRNEARVYLTGGATAVLNGWRETTVDIDLSFVPDRDDLYRSIPEIKEKLHINVEMAAPSDFIPALPGWEDRSKFICREGKVDFFHYDIYSQALSKIERGHEKDVRDVQSMIKDGLIEPRKLFELFKAIEPFLYKYPAIDPKSFSNAVHEIFGSKEK